MAFIENLNVTADASRPVNSGVRLLARNHIGNFMKVSYTHFSPNAPIRDLYQEGADYLRHDFDFGFNDALYLLKELKNHRSSLWIDAPACSLNFYIESDNSLWIEIYGNNGLWAVSEIDLAIGTEILSIAFDGGAFGVHIPTTNRTWDAYSGV